MKAKRKRVDEEQMIIKLFAINCARDLITTKSSESENDKAVDKSTPYNNDDTITEILKSEPKIGYTKPFYHCKKHPRVQYIDHEEIKNHIKYSREHQQST
jgi:hypothetical protein